MTDPAAPGRLYADTNLKLLELVSRLPFTNPFEPAAERLLHAAIAHRHLPADPPDKAGLLDAVERLFLGGIAGALHGVVPTSGEREVLQGAAVYVLWERYAPRLQRLIERRELQVSFWDAFVDSRAALLHVPGVALPEPAHLLALLFQARRAHDFITTKIRGRSRSAAAARAALWRATLGGDLHAYAAGLYRSMPEIPVLITGETGTGKELAAQCLGLSSYLPFDPASRRFTAPFDADFHARNLCEIPRDLIESALFGHRKGAFSGAVADAPGFLALPGEHGTLFLDEIGELPEHVQAKLLRPLQSREYVPLGETRPHLARGRYVFATHRDLAAFCQEGKFRADLHQPHPGARVQMPPLRLMLAEAPGDLETYVRTFVADKLGDADLVERFTERVTAALRAGAPDYPWPGNLRELRNYTSRALLGDLRLPEPLPGERRGGTLVEPVEAAVLPSSGILGPVAKEGRISVEELTRSYVTRVHVMAGENTSETARRTGLDRRTVARWLDPARLRRWLSGKK